MFILLVLRGDIYYADLGKTIGSEQGGIRPVLIIQNDMGNIHSPTVITAAITSQNKRCLPTHYSLKGLKCGLTKDSTVMMEQIRTLDKCRLLSKVGHIDIDSLKGMNGTIAISQGLISMAALQLRQSVRFA